MNSLSKALCLLTLLSSFSIFAQDYCPQVRAQFEGCLAAGGASSNYEYSQNFKSCYDQYANGRNSQLRSYCGRSEVRPLDRYNRDLSRNQSKFLEHYQRAYQYCISNQSQSTCIDQVILAYVVPRTNSGVQGCSALRADRRSRPICNLESGWVINAVRTEARRVPQNSGLHPRLAQIFSTNFESQVDERSVNRCVTWVRLNMDQCLGAVTFHRGTEMRDEEINFCVERHAEQEYAECCDSGNSATRSYCQSFSTEFNRANALRTTTERICASGQSSATCRNLRNAL